MKVFGITGWKNSGKTTLVGNLVKELTTRGYRVSTVKHAHRDFDIDREGSDSFVHRQAGATQVLLSSSRRWALMNENPDEAGLELDALLAHLDPVDLIIVEGFKMGDQPKIQVIRACNNTDVLPESARRIVAIASDVPVETKDYNCEGPCLELDNTPIIADFIVTHCGLTLRDD